jgi:hypothetical protein
LTGPAAINSEAAIARPAYILDQMPSDIQNEKEDLGLTFEDLIDVINPLHHLPVVSVIYRALTGDQISVHARAISGPVGLLVAGATMPVEEATGISASNTLASIFSDEQYGVELATRA